MKFNWEEKVRKHFIKAEDVLLSSINQNIRPYQRPLEPPWIGKLINDYKINGYDRNKPITLNDRYGIVDGRHRFTAAEEFGMMSIPAVIYSFETYTDEVMEYYRQNDWHHPHNIKMYWNARNEGAEPIAQLLYKLEGDEKCYLHDDLNLYGKEGPLKYKIPQALVLINYSVRLSTRWKRSLDDKLREKIAKWNYEEIRADTNDTLQFIYNCWGKDRQISHVIYMARNFEALVRLYNLLKSQHKLKGKYEKSAIKKMKSFQFDEAFRQTSDVGKVALLVSHYNKGLGGGIKRVKFDM